MSISKIAPKPISFSSIDIQTLELELGLKKNYNQAWLQSDFEVSESEKLVLQKLINRSKDLIEYWNEQELIIRQITAILELINFYGDNYNFFSERNLAAQVDDFIISGTVDLMVSSGKYSPIKPYFFIQEYKQQKNPAGDPLAQVLAEMLVAQALNNENTFYGCYIIGKFWNFVILENRNYTVLPSLDTTQIEDLILIVQYLKAIKKYIEAKLKIEN